MRVLVMSDIHANVLALEAVLKHAGTVDEVWCLGDIVGYGPNPNEVVQVLSGLTNLTCLLGNHDAAVAEQPHVPAEVFNGDARRSLYWQREQVTVETLRFIHYLPSTPVVKGEFTLAHGSPRDPLWEYVINTLVARLNFGAFDTDFALVGHSHVQCMFMLDEERDRVNVDVLKTDEEYILNPRAILNPGSVGQPRDRDPRAAYALLDTESNVWIPRRAEYDHKEVAARIRQAGLPEKHANRLSEGW